MANKRDDMLKIAAVDVYLKKRTSRKYVGQLSREHDKFIFEYNDSYLFDDRSIAIGPDLPLIKKKFVANDLFQSFEDRIPSKKNPAYKEYCEMVGIKPSENDPLTLVATLGQKGPSSFIFSPAPRNTITHDDVVHYRKILNLTVREFSELFDFAPATINRIEKKSICGKESMKRLEIYIRFPEVAIYEVNRNRFKVNDNKTKFVIHLLHKIINEDK